MKFNFFQKFILFKNNSNFYKSLPLHFLLGILFKYAYIYIYIGRHIRGNLVQYFSKFTMHKDHLRILVNVDPNSVGLRWSFGFGMSNQLPGDSYSANCQNIPRIARIDLVQWFSTLATHSSYQGSLFNWISGA